MDPATLLGMVMALGALLAMMLLEGSDPLAVILLPPLILVFGATFGAAIAGSTMSAVRTTLPAAAPPEAGGPRTSGFWLPMSTKITRNSDLRIAQMNLLLEGVTEIFEGTNPRALRVRLQSLLPPSEARHTAA